MERPSKPTPSWALSFPEPHSRPLSMSLDALHELMTTKVAIVDFIVIDARRTDIDVVIPGAINLPAQSFYPLLPSLTALLSKIPIVVFYCSSSLGRATRCAGWFEDALPSDSECKVFILEGGMKAWRGRFEEDEQMIIVVSHEEGEDSGTGK
ncbi:hypothetical protein BC827DRAFT_1132096 [Russula dissimulans]|nr:hypothetical protein BC827DRAFT_1132096 [Russula dissimulans]